MTWDPDLDLDHGVLRNRLKLTDPDALAVAEAALTAVRLTEIERHPIRGGYDLPHLQHFHYAITFDVYFFGGRLRTVRMGKGGQAFCPPEEISARVPAVFDRRTDPQYLHHLPRSQVVDELAGLMADLIWLHPFREVNGRSIRAFMAQLSADAGWRLSWANLDRHQNRQAARSAHEGDRTLLRTLLDERMTTLPPDVSSPGP